MQATSSPARAVVATPSSAAGSVRTKQKPAKNELDHSSQMKSLSTPVHVSSVTSPKTPSPSPSRVAKPPLNKSPMSAKASSMSPKSHSRRETPSKSPHIQNPRHSLSASTSSGLPGTPWSHQGLLGKKSSALLSESPASFDKKFSSSISPHISFNGDASVWDDGDMSIDMVTLTDDGAVDEDVSFHYSISSFCHILN